MTLQRVFWQTFSLWGIGIFVLWLWHITAGRRKLIKFFGLSRKKKLGIFIGHLQIQGIPRGVVGFEESSEAKNLEMLFKSVVPGFSQFSGALAFLQLADILPARRGDPSITLEQSSIALGSSLSNQASFLIESDLKSPVRFNAEGAIEIPGLSPVTSNTQGALVKLCLADKCFFYAFGASEPASAGAARYLFRNWRLMRKKYGDQQSFYYLVEIAGGTVASVADHEITIH